MDQRDENRIDRRDFFKQTSILASAAAAAATLRPAAEAPAAEQAALPMIGLGKHGVTRLIAGYNPVGGFSHATPSLSNHMREYFTVERTVEFLRHCEDQGINTFQFDLGEKTEKVLNILRDGGSKLQYICLHSGQPNKAPLDRVMDYNPIAVVHHGGVTDKLFREGKSQQVRDFVKKVRDAGALAGVSSHNPANVLRIADEGWENDLFMTCFYYLTRSREEMEKELGSATVGEAFLEKDPEKMTAVVRKIDKPCLAFKILAAGRKCNSPKTVAAAFQYAFRNIKKTDAVIVGMYPVWQDEVTQNAAFAREYGKV